MPLLYSLSDSPFAVVVADTLGGEEGEHDLDGGFTGRNIEENHVVRRIRNEWDQLSVDSGFPAGISELQDLQPACFFGGGLQS